MSASLHVFHAVEHECQVEWNNGGEVDHVHGFFEKMPLSRRAQEPHDVLHREETDGELVDGDERVDGPQHLLGLFGGGGVVLFVLQLKLRECLDDEGDGRYDNHSEGSESKELKMHLDLVNQVGRQLAYQAAKT